MNSELDTNPSIEINGTKTLATKEDLQRAMITLRSRPKRLDLPNLLRLSMGVPLYWEVRYRSMSCIPDFFVRVATDILALFSLDATGKLNCQASLDAQGFQCLVVARLSKSYGLSKRTIARYVSNLRRAGIIDTKQDGPHGLMIRLNPLVLADWADKLKERKRVVRGPRWQWYERATKRRTRLEAAPGKTP